MAYTTHLLKTFKATLTDANRDYIGSLTLPESLCKKHDLHARQLVHIRITKTGKELWTYIITSSTDSICMNGAAAILAKAGDEIVISAFHHSGWVECAVSKIHRARVSGVGAMDGRLRIPKSWREEVGMEYGQVVSCVNLRNGFRDTVFISDADDGICEVGVQGYEAGDLVIVMAFAWVTLEDLRRGDIPEMKVHFP